MFGECLYEMSIGCALCWFVIRHVVIPSENFYLFKNIWISYVSSTYRLSYQELWWVGVKRHQDRSIKIIVINDAMVFVVQGDLIHDLQVDGTFFLKKEIHSLCFESSAKIWTDANYIRNFLFEKQMFSISILNSNQLLGY